MNENVKAKGPLQMALDEFLQINAELSEMRLSMKMFKQRSADAMQRPHTFENIVDIDRILKYGESIKRQGNEIKARMEVWAKNTVKLLSEFNSLYITADELLAFNDLHQCLKTAAMQAA